MMSLLLEEKKILVHKRFINIGNKVLVTVTLSKDYLHEKIQ